MDTQGSHLTTTDEWHTCTLTQKLTCTHAHTLKRESCSTMFIAMLLPIARKQNVLGCLSIDESVLGNKFFPKEMQHTRQLTLEREPITDQNMNTTKVQLGEPMSFTGVTYRKRREEAFPGAGITQQQLYHQSPPKHKDSSQNWETWSTLYILQAAQQGRECSSQVSQLG